MKRAWLIAIALVLLVSACGVQEVPQVTATPEPSATATLVPPTATLTPTATPIPATEINMYYRGCWFKRAYVGQTVNLAQMYSFKTQEDLDETKVSAQIDEDPWVELDNSLWDPLQPRENSTRLYSTVRWEMPTLPEGKHQIRLKFDLPNQGAFEQCAFLFVTKPGEAFEGNQLIVPDYYVVDKPICYSYTVPDANQPLTLINFGIGDVRRGNVENYINASIETVKIDNDEPIMVTGKDGWGEMYEQRITYDFGSFWSWNLPTLSKGDHRIVIEWGVSKEVRNDSSRPYKPEKPVHFGCVDVTVQ